MLRQKMRSRREVGLVPGIPKVLRALGVDMSLVVGTGHLVEDPVRYCLDTVLVGLNRENIYFPGLIIVIKKKSR